MLHYEIAKEKLLMKSKTDSLTKAYNKETIINVIDDLIKFNEDESFSILMFDIDNFKEINDNYGHITGDVCIKNLVNTVRGSIRDVDVLGRYGGDEFIGVFFNSTPDDLQKRLDLIIQRFNSSPILVNHDKVFITFSYGISCFPEDSRDINDLIKLADKKMYKYKKKFK